MTDSALLDLMAYAVHLEAENERLRQAVRDLAMATPSPQVARLAQAALQQRVNDLEYEARRDPRWLEVAANHRLATERLGRLAT